MSIKTQCFPQPHKNHTSQYPFSSTSPANCSLGMDGLEVRTWWADLMFQMKKFKECLWGWNPRAMPVGLGASEKERKPESYHRTVNSKCTHSPWPCLTHKIQKRKCKQALRKVSADNVLITNFKRIYYPKALSLMVIESGDSQGCPVNHSLTISLAITGSPL